MNAEKDVWTTQSESKQSNDEKHLNSSTFVYIVAWFTFAIFVYVLRNILAIIGFLIFSEEINALYFTTLLDWVVLFLSIYISHGLIFKKTNIRRVFPWLIIVFLGSWGKFSDPYVYEIMTNANLSSESFLPIYLCSFGLFVLLSYKYFSSLSPTRWVSKSKKNKGHA